MSYLGDYPLSATLDGYFSTRRFTTGAPHSLSGGSVAAYEDNGTTEITAGITLTSDFDSRTGLNLVRVVATGANGFETGKSYALVLTAGTVDSVSVAGEVVGSFTIERSPAFSRLGAPVGASLSADIAAIQADTDNIQTRLPTTLISGKIDAFIGTTGIQAGAITSTTFGAGAIDANAIAADAIGSSELAASAITEIQSGLATAASISALNNISTAQVNTEVDTALADAGVTTVRMAKLDGVPEGVKKNQALNNFTLLMKDSVDHVTPKTGLTVTAQRKLDAGSFATCANAVSEVGNGIYVINLAGADLNGDIVTLRFTAPGADAVVITIKTSP